MYIYIIYIYYIYTSETEVGRMWNHGEPVRPYQPKKKLVF